LFPSVGWTYSAGAISTVAFLFPYTNNEFDEWFLDQLEGDADALINMTHQELMERAGVEAGELIMWLIMRGAMSDEVKRLHRNYYVPMTTGMGLITLEDAVGS
jgi:protocatechuate 4,5-dioxygenase, beta chain